jgi:hypothetical protein
MGKRVESDTVWITCSVEGSLSYRIHPEPGRTVGEVLEMLERGAAQVTVDSIQTNVDGRIVRLARVVETTPRLTLEDWREGDKAGT